MTIFHGSYATIETPVIVTQEKGRDFGFGFYTTTIKEQAERWAIRIAKLHSRNAGRTENAVVNVYEYDEEFAKSLIVKDFQKADLDWLNFVIRCRSDLNYHHEFDIVSGKIANDNVGETIDYVLAGIMRKEDAVERLRFEKINDQICFCTEKALKAISFNDAFLVKP